MKLLGETGLGEEEGNRSLGMWGISNIESIIFDVGELEKTKMEFIQTDEGGLLAGDGEEEVAFLIMEYIKRWCESVINGLPKNIGELYELSTNQAGEVYTFVKIRGASAKILDYLQNTWTAGFCTVWQLHMAPTVKSIAILKAKEGAAKEMDVAIVNTGGWATCLEMLGDLIFATNRLHQLTKSKAVCQKIAFPEDPKGEEESAKKAKSLKTGRLLVKNEQKLAAERSIVNQHAAFTTARKITSNAEQRSVMWEGNPE